MKTFSRLLLVPAALLFAEVARAQLLAPANRAQADSASRLAPPGSAAAPAAPLPRHVSSETAAMLDASMPKYEPPAPVKTVAVPETETAKDDEGDEREFDKPKNGIIRLPKFVVRPQTPAIFTERDLYTKEGLAGIALHRYAGLNLGGPFAGMNAPIALQMYQEDMRLQHMSDLTDTARTMSRGGDAGESSYILRQSQDTYARPMDFGGSVPGVPLSDRDTSEAARLPK